MDLNVAHKHPTTGNVVTPRGRMYFCALADRFKEKNKKDKKPDDDGQYAVTLVISPDADIAALRAEIKACAKEKFGDKLPASLKSPIKKCKEIYDKHGDQRYPDELGEHWQIRANTFRSQPGIVDQKGNPLSKILPGESTDDVKSRLKEECYSGRWARITVSPKAYDNDGSRGVKFYLQNVQLLDHDDHLGGRTARAEDEFLAVGDDEDSDGSSDSIFD